MKRPLPLAFVTTGLATAVVAAITLAPRPSPVAARGTQHVDAPTTTAYQPACAPTAARHCGTDGKVTFGDGQGHIVVLDQSDLDTAKTNAADEARARLGAVAGDTSIRFLYGVRRDGTFGAVQAIRCHAGTAEDVAAGRALEVGKGLVCRQDAELSKQLQEAG